jgi:hypothetical protein
LSWSLLRWSKVFLSRLLPLWIYFVPARSVPQEAADRIRGERANAIWDKGQKRPAAEVSPWPAVYFSAHAEVPADIAVNRCSAVFTLYIHYSSDRASSGAEIGAS